MSEFEWRRGLRDLGGPQQPSRDLWLDIAARIAAEEAVPVAPARMRPWRRWASFAAAASLVAGVLVTSHWMQADRAPVETAFATVDDTQALFARTNASLREARPQDPRLAGAAVELDAAASEIEQSLSRQPDAVFLVGLLNRTNERRVRLSRMGRASG